VDFLKLSGSENSVRFISGGVIPGKKASGWRVVEKNGVLVGSLSVGIGFNCTKMRSKRVSGSDKGNGRGMVIPFKGRGVKSAS
jgi:hypothetical protein